LLNALCQKTDHIDGDLHQEIEIVEGTGIETVIAIGIGKREVGLEANHLFEVGLADQDQEKETVGQDQETDQEEVVLVTEIGIREISGEDLLPETEVHTSTNLRVDPHLRRQ